MLGDIQFNRWCGIFEEKYYISISFNAQFVPFSIVTPHVATLDATLVLVHATNNEYLSWYGYVCIEEFFEKLIVLAPATGCCLLFSRQFAAKKASRKDNDEKKHEHRNKLAANAMYFNALV